MTTMERKNQPTPKELQTRKQETGFPQDLDGRMEVILSSFNTSPETTTILIFPPDSEVNGEFLIPEFRKQTLGSKIADFSRIHVAEYCTYTLIPMGLVEEKTALDYYGTEKTVGLALTQAGKKYGRPAAAFIIDFETRNDFSIFPIFGQTSTPREGETRAPLNRTKILKYLNSLKDSDPAPSNIEIARKLEMNPITVANSLRALRRAGTVDYEAVTPHTRKKQVYYVLKENGVPLDNLKSVRQIATLTKQIAKTCLELVSKNIVISAKNIFDHLPTNITHAQTRNLLVEINRILSGLTEQNFLERGIYKGAKKLSNAKITDKGRIVVEELIKPFEDALSDGPMLEKMQQEILPKVLENLHNYIVISGNLYYPHSNSAKIQEWPVVESNMLSLVLGSRTNGIDAREVSEKVGCSPKAARKYLNNLTTQGSARKKRVNGVFLYFPLN